MSGFDPKNDVGDSFTAIKTAFLNACADEGMIMSKDIRTILIWLVEYTKKMQSQFFGISIAEIEKFDQDVQVQLKDAFLPEHEGTPLVINQPETEHIWGG